MRVAVAMTPRKVLIQVMTAASADDLRGLLSFWAQVATPIPEDEFSPVHPYFKAVVYAARALDALAEQRMTQAQRVETARRLLLGARHHHVHA
jgi:hypothetical protein